jgi:hypothetical protein
MPTITRQMTSRLCEHVAQNLGGEFLTMDYRMQLQEIKVCCEELFSQFFPRENRDCPGAPIFFAPPRAQQNRETYHQHFERLQADFSFTVMHVRTYLHSFDNAPVLNV